MDLASAVTRARMEPKSTSRDQFFVEFEVLRSTLELPDHLFDDTSKQGRKVMKNDMKMEALGDLLGCLGKLLGSLRWLSCHLAGFVACFCQVLGHFMRKKVF